MLQIIFQAVIVEIRAKKKKNTDSFNKTFFKVKMKPPKYEANGTKVTTYIMVKKKQKSFLFPALIRYNSAEWEAHSPHIILKIELQHLKQWTVC